MRQGEQTPRTEEFFREKVRLMLNPEDFASPWAQARVMAQIEEMLMACRLFSRTLEREVNASVPRKWLV